MEPVRIRPKGSWTAQLMAHMSLLRRVPRDLMEKMENPDFPAPLAPLDPLDLVE